MPVSSERDAPPGARPVASDEKRDPFASPRQTGAESPTPPTRDALYGSQRLIGALRSVDAGCSLLAFLIAVPGALGLVGAAMLPAIAGLPPIAAVVIAGGSLCLVAFGCAIHFRQRWALWITLSLLILAGLLDFGAAIWNLDPRPLIGIAFLVPPIWLCLRILAAASELESVGIPLSAEVRHGRIVP